MPQSCHYADYGAYEEVQIVAAAKGAEAPNPGAYVQFVIKSGGNAFHGSFLTNYEDDSFQSTNVTKKLLDRGFAPGSNKFTRYTDINGDIGGPILRDKLWFYGSYRDEYQGTFIPGFISLATGQPAIFFTKLQNPTLKLTYQLTNSMKLETVGQLGRKWQPYRGANRFNPLESTQNQDSWSMLGPSLKWTYIVGPKMTTDVSINRWGYWWPRYTWTKDVRITDLTTGQTRGSFIRNYDRPIRWAWTGNWSWFNQVGGKNNEIKSGFTGWWDKSYTENIGYPNQQIYRYRSLSTDGTNYFLRPDSVQVFDYPNFVTDGTNYNSWFINDKITWNRKLTLNVGLRFDRRSSWLPEQGNPGTGPFATKNLYAERRDFPVYNAWVPRVSFVYDVTGEGKLALKASYGRYSSGGPNASSVNPASSITKTYNNWDGTIPYVPRPQDLASTSGGGGIQTLDKNLDGSYTDEYTTGIEMGFNRDYSLRFNVVRKMDYGGSKVLDLAQPLSAYTDVRYAVDPGRDNIVGTADDRQMQAWSVPRTYPTFGQVINHTVQVAENEGNDLYTAYEVTFNKQYSDKWSLLVSYLGDFAKTRGNIPTTPNGLIYRWEYPTWNNTWKLSGQYDLPWGLMYSSAYLAQTGDYHGRSAQMRNALNSNVTLTVEGRVGRYDRVKLWDNRISKTFQMGDRHSIEGMFDLFNSLNSSVVTGQTNQNGPDYLKPTSIISPRIFRLGVRWKF